MKNWWRTISSVDRRFLALISLGLVLATSLPMLYATFFPPVGYQYNGLQSLSPGDTPVYYSYILQARSGQFLAYDLLTPEYAQTRLFQPVWLLIGWFARLFVLTPPVAFHAARVLLIPFFVMVAWHFVGLFFSGAAQRRGLLWVLCTTGLGAYALPFFTVGPLANLPSYWSPQDVWVPEAVTFLAPYRTPHFILSLGCLLLIVVGMSRLTEQFSYRRVIGIGVIGLFLFSFHPYYVLTVYGAFGMYVLGIAWQSRRVPWRLLLAISGIVLISLPAVAYHAWALYAHWPLAARGFQNHIPGPPLGSILIGYGFLWPLAAVGVWSVRRAQRPADVAALSILIVATTLVLVPVQFQSKYFEGIQPILAVFGALGATVIGQWLARRRWATVATSGGVRPFGNRYIGVVIFIALLTMTNIFALARDWFYVTTQPPQARRIFYLSNETLAVFDALRQSPQGMVIASPTTGVFVPGYTGQPVYIGHGHETLFPHQRSYAVTQFFFGGLSSDQRITWLRKHHVRYIIADGELLASTQEGLRALPGVTLRLALPTIELYEVLPE